MSVHLFSARGLADLDRLNSKPFLLAFDFDGTLAPLVADPGKARVPQSWRVFLNALALRIPIAVISGRCVFQLKACLQIPQCLVVGNHGAQPLPQAGVRHSAAQPESQLWIKALDPCRDEIELHRGHWQKLGIVVEDKGYSIALHYRTATNKAAARRLLEQAVQDWLKNCNAALFSLRVWRGHDVINLICASAPDKGDALLKLQKDLGLGNALFVGDDSNDEPAFEKALSGSVTVKVGCAATATAAQFFLPRQRDVGQLLGYLCR